LSGLERKLTSKKTRDTLAALRALADPETETFIDPMWEFRSAVVRLLVAAAARNYADNVAAILDGTHGDILDGGGIEVALLKRAKAYVERHIYDSRIVRHREITAHQVVSGLLDAHFKLLHCDRSRFGLVLDGKGVDALGSKITIESGLMIRFPRKCLQAYRVGVDVLTGNGEELRIMEWILRAHLLVDYVSGMTDEYALSSFQLVSGMRSDLEM
jgi:dGTPase